MAPDRTVHIVDDDAAFCRALERLLRSAGFATASYETSLALLDAATRRLSGCLLLDVWLPGMDGLELQGRLDMSRLAEAIRLSVMAGMAPAHAADQSPNNDGPRHVRSSRGPG